VDSGGEGAEDGDGDGARWMVEGGDRASGKIKSGGVEMDGRERARRGV